MKKLSLLFLVVAGMATAANAQDIITLKNGNEIKAKVTEISSSEIKYKRFDNQDGPTVTVAKSEVFAVNYENGTREVISTVSMSDSGMKTEFTPFTFGLKGGVNLAMGFTTPSSDMLIGFHFGAMGQYRIGNAGIQLEAQFSMQGVKIPYGDDSSGSYTEDNTSIKLNYINIPLIMQYYLAPGFALEAGPQLGILISANASAGGNSENIKPYCNSVDFSIAAGLSYQLPTVPLGFHARYIVGLTTVDKGYVFSESKHSVVQVGMFFRF